MEKINKFLSNVIYGYQLLLWTIIWFFVSIFAYAFIVEELSHNVPLWKVLIIPIHVFGLWLCFLSRFIRIPKETFCKKFKKYPIVHASFHLIWALKMYFQYVWAVLFLFIALLFLFGEGKKTLFVLAIKFLFEFHVLGFVYITLEEHLKQYYNWKMLLYTSAIIGAISTIFSKS